MSTPTLATALPTPAEIAQAVDDSDFYADTLTRLGGPRSPKGIWFMNEVLRQWKAQHPAEPQPEQPAPRPLDYVEKRILDFANRRFRDPGHREQAVRDEFGFSATRYFQRLGALIDRPEAQAYSPILVKTLRARREHARRTRQHAERGAAR